MIDESIKLIIPGLIGNVASWAFGKIKAFNLPLDFYLKLEGKRILGKNKTIKGFFACIVFAAITNFIISDSLITGALMGFSVSFGDLTKSFFKRRLGIKEGKNWLPFDLMDLPIGYLIFVFPALNVKFEVIAYSVFLSIAITYLAQTIWKFTGMKK